MYKERDEIERKLSLYKEREKIKEEQRKIIGIEPVIDMRNFVELLLANLAYNSTDYSIDYNRPELRTFYLSTEYNKIIEDIMYQENGWGIRFAQIINIHSYYEYQLDWEKKLSRTIEKVLKELNAEYYYDFEYNFIVIKLSTFEITRIRNAADKELTEIMHHFSNLVNDASFKREFRIKMNTQDRNVNRSKYKNYISKIEEFRREGFKNPQKVIGEFEPVEMPFKRK